MNYIDMVLENLQVHFDLHDLDDIFGIEKFGDTVEVTAPNGSLLYITDTKTSFLSLYTAHADNPVSWTFAAPNLSTVEATGFLAGFIAAHL